MYLIVNLTFVLQIVIEFQKFGLVKIMILNKNVVIYVHKMQIVLLMLTVVIVGNSYLLECVRA